MTVYLIRHGESTSDIDNLYGGNYDDHLTKRGQEQAGKLADELTNRGIQIVFSSPFIRAMETSNALKDVLGCDIQIIKDLRERNSYGFLTGTNKHEAKNKYPELIKKMKDYHFTIKDGEGYDSFTNRIHNVFDKITNSKYKIIAMVTHGGPIRCLLREVLKAGEFVGDLGDCAVIELEKNDSYFNIVNMNGALLAQTVN